MSLRVLLADDHQIVREGIRAVLEREGLEVVGEGANGREAVELALKVKPDVAVLDLMMPLLNGVEAAREILQRCPGTRVILLTMHSGERQIMTALRAGIHGYVIKTQPAEDLIRAIHDVRRGQVYVSPQVSRAFVDGYLGHGPLLSDPLAPRERQVLQLVAEGKSTKEVASLLDLTVKTAESYRTRVMEKLDIHDTAGLVRYAVRQGVIEP